MSPVKSISKATVALAALASALVMTSAMAFAASEFIGKWKTTDSQGKPFTIWLSDGKAKGDLARNNKGLAGMWKEEGNSAVITWDYLGFELDDHDHQGRQQLQEEAD